MIRTSVPGLWRSKPILACGWIAALLVITLRSATAAGEPIHFSLQVLPILADNCFACHGPDEKHRQADLRLDTRDGALTVINLDRASESELLARVTSTDAELQMPPPRSHKKAISTDQVLILKQWIEAGAPWGRHWAFERPVKVQLPIIAGSHKEVHPVDAFVRAKLLREGLELAPEAARQVLARRVSFDLIGMPPTPEEVTAFEQDLEPSAYERFVDRLLQSEHFGERMAMWWLDAARYADTDGFQGDATRTNWPWRDWVVNAFNANMPFDRFTLEQFAGDLLPDATPEQKLATCFHRNHMTNGEGGRDPEESRIDYVIDRVNSIGTLWLGMTLGCCQCHSHKYDPISQSDYYALTAFFNSIDEDGKAGREAKPFLTYESPHVARTVAEAQALVDERKLCEAEARHNAAVPFAEWVAARAAETRDGFSAWRPLVGAKLESSEGTRLDQEPDGTVQTSGPHPNQDDYRVVSLVKLPRVTGVKLEVFPHPAHTEGSYSRGRGGHFVLTDIKVQVRCRGSSQVRDVAVSSAIADHADDPKKYEGYGNIQHVLDDDPRNGWSTRDADSKQPRTALFALSEPLLLEADEEFVFELRHRSTLGDANIGRFRVSVTDQAGPTVNRLDRPPLEQLAASKADRVEAVDEVLRSRLLEQFLADHAPYQEAKLALDRADRQLGEANSAKKVDVMVLAERPAPRESHVLVRGVWDKKGESVSRDVPPALASWSGEGPRSRVGLAQWIASRDNPLAARVLVNHLWQLLFGMGLVRTPEDFGVQGDRPSHPELLDWLAVDLMDHDWDIKRLLRLIVTSQTYRQRSAVSAALLTRDPENRLLARGARFRLPSWMLRDSALRASGLLNPALGGPPVKPYQPEGVWEEMFMGRFHYESSDGAAQYRRTLYAFWRRAVAPTFLFDSAQRRVCEVRAPRTNTPLQALTLLNDATYLEAARVLAEKGVRSAVDASGRVREITRRILLRNPSDRELTVLVREYDRAMAHYRGHPEEASKLLQTTNPNSRIPARIAADSPESLAHGAEIASALVVASLVLNLDEAMTHE